MHKAYNNPTGVFMNRKCHFSIELNLNKMLRVPAKLLFSLLRGRTVARFDIRHSANTNGAIHSSALARPLQ